MKFAQYFNHLLDKYAPSKKFLADKIGVSKGYIINIAKGHDGAPNSERIMQISLALNLTKEEKLKLLQLAYEERQSPEDLAFQEALRDQMGLESIKEVGGSAWILSGDRSVKDGNKSILLDQGQMLSWKSLYKLPIIVPFRLSNKNKGATMIRSIIEDADNVPEFGLGDEITITTKYSIEDSRFYLLRDGQGKKIILRQIKVYGDNMVLRTSNMKIDEPFDKKRFEIIGRIVKHERNL